MPSYTTADIRNVLLAGQGGSGKTTLADALLFASGTVNRKASVTDGSSFSDFEKEEKEHGHSIYASVLHLDHAGKRINLIDSPGSPDLIGQAIAATPAVETVAVVINAQNGIEVVTRRMMEIARERNLCRAIIVNKIDMPEVDLDTLVQQIRDTFGSECLPINLPTGGGKAVVECLLNTQADFDTVKRCHAAILDQIVEMDENLMEKYLGGEEPDYSALHEPFERAMDEGHVVPILFTDAKNGVGVKELLDAIVMHFPSPLEGNMPAFMTGEGADERPFDVKEDGDRPLLAHVFKVTTDPFVGKLALFRVHQGKVTGQSQVFIGHNKKAIKLGHVFHLQGKEHREVPEIVAGDIGAVAKIEEIDFNAVLHDSHDEDHIRLRSLDFPTPMHSIAVETKKKGDEQRLFDVLHKLEVEDPCLWIERHPTTHETVMRGLGDLHMRTKLEKMQQQYRMDVSVKPPKIPYRETITRRSEGHCRHKKQTGGAGQFGEVFLKVEPLARGAGFEFVDQVKGGVIPTVFIPAVEKGVRQALDHGVIAGYPVEDIRVTVYDGKSHPVDSKEIAFVTAGRKATIDAILKATPILLEPIVTIEITAPDRFVGDLTSDLSSKRGQVTGTESSGGGLMAIQGMVPLSEVTEYQSRLRSVTGGQGAYTVEFSHYAAVPPSQQQQLTSQFKLETEEV
jgi:elongation factor G